MTKEQIEFFRKLLGEKLEELIDGGQETIFSLNEYRDTLVDPIDRSATDQMLNMRTRIKDRESKLMNKIKEALIRINEGTFGICEICEEEISIERLKARPVTTQCINCKTKEELLEKTHIYKSFPN